MRLRVPTGEQQDDARDENQEADQAPAGGPCRVAVGRVDAGPRAAGEHGDDEVLRQRKQPPLDEDQAARERLRILDVQPRRVVRDIGERERRVTIGSEPAVGVEAHAPGPAHHPDVEVEDRARVAPGEQDREERDHGQDNKREPQEHEHDDVRDHQDPLDQPQPATNVVVELPLDAQRIHRWGVLVQGTHSSQGRMGAFGAVFKVSRGSPAPLLRARAAVEAGRKRSHSSGSRSAHALICFYAECTPFCGSAPRH